MDKHVDSPESNDGSKAEMDAVVNNKGNDNKPEAKPNPSSKISEKDVYISIPELEPVCNKDVSNGVASNDEDDKNNGVASNDEGDKSNGISSNDESDEINKVARNIEGIEIVSNDESDKKEDTDDKVFKISSNYQKHDTNKLPGDVVNTNVEENIMYSILQADIYHNNDGHTGHMLKERFNTNINSHRNPDVNDDSARGLTVSDNSENDVTKGTTALEFLTKAERRAATIGSLVRFMWNPGTETSLCWVQGVIYKRVDSYKKSRKEKWNTNRVVVKNLEIANCWGEEYTQKLPKTMVVDLNRKQTWAL